MIISNLQATTDLDLDLLSLSLSPVPALCLHYKQIDKTLVSKGGRQHKSTEMEQRES